MAVFEWLDIGVDPLILSIISEWLHSPYPEVTAEAVTLIAHHCSHRVYRAEILAYPLGIYETVVRLCK